MKTRFGDELVIAAVTTAILLLGLSGCGQSQDNSSDNDNDSSDSADDNQNADGNQTDQNGAAEDQPAIPPTVLGAPDEEQSGPRQAPPMNPYQ